MKSEKYRKLTEKSTSGTKESPVPPDVNPNAKRIKRRVVGREHEFFIATSPRLNSICRQELLSLKLPIKEPEAVPGGVIFTGRLADCYAANLKLRTANRILMRINDFKATNFRQLEKAAKNIPWELYLNSGCAIRITVSVKKCRLYHKEAVRQHFFLGMNNNTTGLNFREAGDSGIADDIYIRGGKDRFTISLDSSGKMLFKRGIKTHGAKAPIRETLAAAALHMAGYTGELPLLDPMCGSGTCALEAAMTAGNIPAGLHRTFAFMNWPSFRSTSWEHMKREAKTRTISPASPIVFASDVDMTAVAALDKTVSDYGLSGIIDVSHRDFFQSHPGDIADRAGFIFLNPPYGIRLNTKKESIALFRAIVDKLKNDYGNWTFIIVLPRAGELEGLTLSGTPHRIFHGGLELGLAVGKI